MTTSPASHAGFVIERVFDAAPAQVFAAFADPAAKARWFGAPEFTECVADDVKPGKRMFWGGFKTMVEL